MLMPDLEIFRTSLTCPAAAAALRDRLLQGLPPGARVSFDLEDCDRVLRVHTPGRRLDVARVVATLRESGYLCEPLPD
ncbi:hypothetical protein LJ737_22970 [Hymenobacter sp. 15J16-1T3B]|uniref:hypothetical protein n=1 Tax=Hymenobacter sp. 15J16-1T3B TaxID=2886941 RepID=UPI001D0FDEF8|nr:hypothetical protein [Hymenobacter sp. 15J16-1T3B]MCC3160116.1 hypothetical protein [Hymenobacter sp. 15J16-1T3B]